MKIAGLALMGAVTAALVVLLNCGCTPAISAFGGAILAGSEMTPEPTNAMSTCWYWSSEGANMPHDYEYLYSYACEDGCDCRDWDSHRIDVLVEKDRYRL